MILDVKLNVVTFIPDSICYIVGCSVFCFSFSWAILQEVNSLEKNQETNNQVTFNEPNK